jgi:hypothetical protein
MSNKEKRLPMPSGLIVVLDSNRYGKKYRP